MNYPVWFNPPSPSPFWSVSTPVLAQSIQAVRHDPEKRSRSMCMLADLHNLEEVLARPFRAGLPGVKRHLISVPLMVVAICQTMVIRGRAQKLYGRQPRSSGAGNASGVALGTQ
ncbi:MAG TPA: hypothetical protein VGF67_33955 [Ktedonobacteraceae bacterium]